MPESVVIAHGWAPGDSTSLIDLAERPRVQRSGPPSRSIAKELGYDPIEAGDDDNVAYGELVLQQVEAGRETHSMIDMHLMSQYRKHIDEQSQVVESFISNFELFLEELRQWQTN